MKKIVLLSFALLFTLITLPAQAGGIQVNGAWVRAAPPTVQVLAAYMTIKNSGSVGKTVVGAHSPQFAKVEFHETLIRNGMASMVARSSLAISPGGEVILSPGGYHMMLIAPQRMIRKGDKITVTLRFSDGTTHKLIADVRKKAGKAMDHSKMDHSAMGQGQNQSGMMERHQMMGGQHQMMGNQHQMMNQQQMMDHHQKMMGMMNGKQGAVCQGMMGKGGMPCMHQGQKMGSCPCMKKGMTSSKNKDHDDDDDKEEDDDKDKMDHKGMNH
jgi:periplasmic copper chaperone A